LADMALMNQARFLCQLRLAPHSVSTGNRVFHPLNVSRRTMASNRNHTVEGVSNETQVTEEVRDLIRNARHAENVDEWKRGVLMDEKISVKTWRPNRDADIDDDQHFDIEYHPHVGEKEEWEANYEPPLVLLAEIIASSNGEPYWHKMALEKLGLLTGSYIGKRVAVPNMTHYTSLLYQVKHLVRVIPVRFPNGVPSEAEFDPKMAKMTDTGEFLYHPKIKQVSNEVEAAEEKSEKLLIQPRTYKRKANLDWRLNTTGSPLGNSNYHRNTGILNPQLSNRVTDYAHKIKY